MARHSHKKRTGKGRRAPVTYAAARPTHRRSNSFNLNWFPKVISFARTLVSMLPYKDPQTQTFIKLAGLIDIAFNFISTSFDSKTYYHGGYAMFVVSPAPLLVNSPLLAKEESGSYSFPGHPVRMRSIGFTINNTSALEERAGQWAAVFVPYREQHDASHYVKVVESLTFEELASMPQSRVGPASRPLELSYTFRDKSQYCSQPRELTEAIGFVCVMWDVRSRSSPTQPIEASTFNCEVQVYGRVNPYVIFGPQHRVSHSAADFTLKCLTTGDKVREHHEDGAIILRDLNDGSYEVLE